MQANLVRTMANSLSMDDKSAVEFLDKVAAVKDIINEISGWTWESPARESIDIVYKELDKLLSPLCPQCTTIAATSRAERFITSPAELYDSDMAELPGGSTKRWTGEWYCPRCHHLIAVGKRWWDQSK